MNQDKAIADIKQRIGIYPDFPKKGIDFKDIFPLFKQPSLFEDVVQLFEFNCMENNPKIDVVVGLDARGFLFAPLLATRLQASFVPVRKKGKLPGELFSVSYELEYGKDTLELQKSSIEAGQNVVVVDDLMATGGTMSAVCKLIQKVNANIVKCLCVIELTGLKGVQKLPAGVPFYSIVQYEF